MRQCRDDALSPTPVSFSPGVGKCKHKYAISHQLDGLNQQGCRRNHWQFEASICYWEDSPHFALSRALDIFEVHVLVGLSSPGSSWLNCAPCSRSSDSLVSVGTLICQSGAVLLFCFWVFFPPRFQQSLPSFQCNVDSKSLSFTKRSSQRPRFNFNLSLAAASSCARHMLVLNTKSLWIPKTRLCS